MSGTDTAIAELNEPTVEPEVAAAPPRPAALPYLSVANARDAIAWYVDVFGASARRRDVRDGRRPHRTCRARDRRRRALPGRRVSRARPESAFATGEFGEPDAACGRHRRDPGTGAGAWRRWCNGSRTRTTASRKRHHCRPVRASVDAQRAGHRRRRSHSAWRRRAMYRCGRRTPSAPPRSTATCWAGPTTRVTHQVTNTKEHIGIYSVDGPAHPVLLLRGGRSRGRPAVDHLDGGGTGRRGRSSSTSARCATPPIRRARHSPSSNRFRASRGPSSTAQGQANFRTSPTRCPTRRPSRPSTAACCSGPSSRVASTDGWRCSRPTRWLGSPAALRQPTTVPMWTVEDVEAAVARVREAGGTVIEEPSQQPYGKTAQCTDDQGGRFYLGEF